jgi:hypothetical protein
MSFDDTAETITDDRHPDWRVRIVVDYDAELPYDESAAHVVSLDGNQYDAPAGADADSVRRAWSYYQTDASGIGHWRDEYALTERYLRIWHGASHFEYVSSCDGSWIVFDSAERREAWGCDPEHVPSNVNGTASEWRACVESDVYGIVVERFRTGHTVWNDGTEDDPEEWAVIESVWGFYGAEYAQQAARELLTETAS